MTRNRLADETSPYLLQHKDNPVHWWPWGEAALAEAKKSNKPILLSVGYAACHWCHVMAHESFEDDEVAAVMNELFVNIKVDREERPDVDTIYMNALHALGEQGGWPLTMFLTPQAEPFWGGTYFPKQPKYGRPGFIAVMQEVSRIYTQEPEKIESNASALTAHVAPKRGPAAQGEISEAHIADAAQKIAGLTDPVNGGLKGAPKFPQSPLFALLWRAALRYGDQLSRDAVTKTLTHICQGGIYDHLGGGFARYTVDGAWLVPHFEKMLYDNAQLVELLVSAWQETRDPLYEQRIRETVRWLEREMTLADGGFASSLDADSEGEEGRFYVWSLEDIRSVLGKDDAEFFARAYDATPGGNWEGKIILNRLQSLALMSEEEEARLETMREKLLEARSARVRPGFDDKVLADWNGLMISALTKAGFAFGETHWIEAAARAFQFISTRMNHEGRLYHSWREGAAKTPGTASDHAAMIRAALDLFSITGEEAYLEAARGWTDVMNSWYWADDLSGYTLAASDTTDILVRPFSGHDDATPNPNGLMLENLVGLWMTSGEDPCRKRAETLLDAFTGSIASNLFAHTSLLSGAMDVIAPLQVVIVAEEGRTSAQALLEAIARVALPGMSLLCIEDPDALPDASPAKGKTMVDGKPTAYVCSGTTCLPPVNEPEALEAVLREQRQTATPA